MTDLHLSPDSFRQRQAVLLALRTPRSPRSILNFMCRRDTADLENRESLNKDDGVRPLMSIWFKSGTAYPDFQLFKERNKPAIEQNRQVLQKFGRDPQRNTEFGRANTSAEQAWLYDVEQLPVWAGGTSPFHQANT